MRIRKTKSTKVDLSTPVDLSSIKEDDSCFGKEWDITEEECLFCLDHVLCGDLYKLRVLNKVKDLESSNTFLDQVNFEGIDQDELVKEIHGMTTEELISLVSKKLNIFDRSTVVLWIKRFVKSRRDVGIIKGKVYVKYQK